MHAKKRPSFLQVDFNTLGIKVSYKMTLLLLTGMIKHFQSTEINEFAISLQYLKKKKKDGVHKRQTFCTLALLFLMEVARHVQNTQNRKLIIL